MIRTYAQHDVRMQESLDGRWDFIPGCDRKDRRRLPQGYSRKIQVPSAWESLPGLETYRGKSWYRTEVTAIEGTALRLVFGGVSHTGTVFVDGRKAGSHDDAFTPWDVVVPGLKTGIHEVVVEVDNTFGEHSGLHKENDYYTYGGITRPVELQHVPAVYIERVHAVPRKERGGWQLDLTVRLKNWSRQDQQRKVLVMLGSSGADFGKVTVKAGGEKIVKGVIRGLNVDAWDEHNPNLYYLETMLFEHDVVVDDLVERIGFREITIRGRKILINGKTLRLRGYNRHEDHPQFGNALPVEAMVADLEIMRDLGCNVVRTCHYPNDMRFLDLCDEMGMYVWEESHARDVDFAHPAFDRQIEQSTREMVDWHFNNPSIVIWGCLNECDSTSRSGRSVHRRVLQQLRKLDGSRPVTFASNKAEQDICLDLVDIVSWNRYDAWYRGGPERVEPALKDVLKWLHSPRSGGRNKPVIMSEFGAGAIFGERQRQRAKWSEEYQCDCLDESLRVYLNHPDVSGAIIWQFCDCRVTAGWWGSRPRTFNNKGTVDEYRRFKSAYEVVKRRMHEAAERLRRKK